MCLAMNPDKLAPGERCASTSNRNFEGRQGFKGRTHLVSPAMAAAAAIAGILLIFGSGIEPRALKRLIKTLLKALAMQRLAGVKVRHKREQQGTGYWPARLSKLRERSVSS